MIVEWQSHIAFKKKNVQQKISIKTNTLNLIRIYHSESKNRFLLLDCLLSRHLIWHLYV